MAQTLEGFNGMVTDFGESRGTHVFALVLIRIIFMMLRVALAVILLSDISIEPSYTEVYQSPVLDAGLSPINTSIANSYDFNELALPEFWWYFNTILSDTRNVRVVEPLSCPQGQVCTSYFLPGSPGKIVPDLSQPDLTPENFTNAISFIQHDAPGYQLDFSPIQSDVPPMVLSDCRLYGTSQFALEICLKSVNTSFIAGTSNPGLFAYASLESMSRLHTSQQRVLKHK